MQMLRAKFMMLSVRRGAGTSILFSASSII